MVDIATVPISSILRDKLDICAGCISLLCRDGTGVSSKPPELERTVTCQLCFGIVADCHRATQATSTRHSAIASQLGSAAKPYGGIAANPIAGDSPTVALPAAMMVRAYAALCALEIEILKQKDGSPDSTVKSLQLLRNHVEYFDEAKEYVRNIVREEICHLKQGEQSHCEAQLRPPYPYSDVTTEMKDREEGYLGVHVLLVPPKEDDLVPPGNVFKVHTRRREKKRFRGNDPTEKQGGDPKENLVKRVRKEIFHGDGSWNMERNNVQKELEQVLSRDVAATKKMFADWFFSCLAGDNIIGSTYSVHVAVWRRAFYVGAKYTKSSRDCSQSPFYVPGGPGGLMVKKGSTSVEEEICPILAKSCGGISRLNNEAPCLTSSADRDDEQSNSKAGAVVFGMAKFHASGREDIDVRMLLPPTVSSSGEIDGKIGGRPFVCEVIDALRVPNHLDLTEVRKTINATEEDDDYLEVTDIVTDAGIASSGKTSSNQTHAKRRRYGCNNNGVDISSLSYCTALAFKGLQGETENKVKHYGCAVWCEKPIHSQKELNEHLDEARSRLPLEIFQSTPLRVLHRRASAVRSRHILTMTANRVNDHWFSLHISTSAGTYVKEFVHGDCGRTNPSISSILGCKTDIFRLDCEGIQV